MHSGMAFVMTWKTAGAGLQKDVQTVVAVCRFTKELKKRKASLDEYGTTSTPSKCSHARVAFTWLPTIGTQGETHVGR